MTYKLLHRLVLIFWVGLTLSISEGPAQASQSSPPAETRWESYILHPEDHPEYQAMLVFWIIPDPGIYTYSFDPGPTGYPTRLNLAEPFSQRLDVYYPPGVIQPDPFEPAELASVYPGLTPIFIPMPSDLEPQGVLEARASFLLCSDRNCWPVNKEVSFDLARLQESHQAVPGSSPWWSQWEDSVLHDSGSYEQELAAHALLDDEVKKYFFEVRSFTPGLEVGSLFKAAFLAFLAGMILNFMPCVLPVISLKLRGMIPDNSHAPGREAQKRAFRVHNLFFAAGMMIFFGILAVIISLTGMAWGQVFQNPIAIVMLSAVVFGLGLSLFGLYDLPVIDLKSRSITNNKNPNLEALSTGMLATLLATPCSGPFLGGVLAWALTQPPATIAFVLFCVGLGMASPYITMSFFPFLVRFLPRPGSWTQYLEKGLGFLLMATCIYLITLLPETLIMETLILFWIISVGAWIWGKWTNYSQRGIKRILIRSFATLLVLGSAFLLFKPREYYPAVWMAFNQQKFDELWGEKNFLVEFTADWCPNCKFLEKTVLTPTYLNRIGAEFDMVFIRVDLTYKNPAGENLLRSLDSMSIPLVAVFDKNNPNSPLILRDLFTRNQLMNALNQEFR